MFEAFIEGVGVFQAFFDTIIGFGFKVRDDDEFSGCNIRVDNITEEPSIGKRFPTYTHFL